MGLLKTAGHKVLSKVSSTSAGKLETGTAANKLYNDFKKYLGQTGEQAEADVVLKFLQSRGLPTEDAEKIIQAAGDNQQGSIGQAFKASAGDAVDAVKGMIKGKGGNQPQQGKDPAQQPPTQGKDQNPQPKGRIDPKLDPAPDDDQSKQNFSQGNYKQGGYSTSTGFDPTTMKNVQKELPAGSVGGIPNPSSAGLTPKTGNSPQSTADLSVKPTGRKQGGGRVAGQLSQTPGAVRKREQRAAKKSRGNTNSAIGQFVKTQLGDNPIRMKTGESIEYHYDKLVESLDYNPIFEALSKSVLDKVFLAAVQNAAKVGGAGGGQSQAGGGASGGQSQAGGGQSQASGGQSQASGGAGGFFSGLKQGWQGGPGVADDGRIKGNVNVGQLAQLLQVDQRELSAALMKLKQGQGLSRTHVNTLSNAFISMYRADAQTTVKIANMLKRVTFEEK